MTSLRMIGVSAFFAGFALAAAAADETPSPELAAASVERDLFARDSFRLTPIVCPFKGTVEYDPETVSCGLLEVPENREKSRSRTLSLHYVKLAARKPDAWDEEKQGPWARREDPVVYLTGGPGAQVASYVPRFVNHGVRDVRDMYILEQRGIGASQDFCPLYSAVDPAAANTAEWEAYQRASLSAMEDCFRRAKDQRVDLSAYNTIENARDVRALRRALGFSTWNVWGISYGSILGQAYLKEDREGVRAAVLDAIVPIDPAIGFQGVGRHYQRSLDILDGACKADPKCAAAYPDFIGDLKRAVRAAMLAPIEVEALDPETFPAGKAWFFADLVAGLPFIQLYEQKTYAALPALITAMADAVESGDTDRFKALTGDFGPSFFGISEGMYNAIACNDGWVTTYEADTARDLAAHPELGVINGDPNVQGEVAGLCRRYGMKPRDEAEYAPLTTDIPMLVIEGAMDPITPPPFAEAIMPGLKNGRYVEFAFAGHGPSRSVKCAGEFLTAFFDDPAADLDMSCPESMTAPAFLGPILKSEAAAKLLVLAAEDKKAAAVPALWFGGSALALLVGFVIYTLAPAARVLNRTATPTTHGARMAAWATSVLGAAAIVGLAAATHATFKANEALLLFGFVGWARWFAAAGLLAGAAGLATLWLTLRGRARAWMPVGVLTGLAATAAGGIGIAAFLIRFGLLPF